MARKKTDWPEIYPNKNAAAQIVSYTVDLGMQKIPIESITNAHAKYFPRLGVSLTQAAVFLCKHLEVSCEPAAP